MTRNNQFLSIFGRLHTFDGKPVTLSEIAADTPLPEDFPGRKALAAAGIQALEDVPRKLTTLTAIAGIGEKTAVAVLEALDGDHD